MQMDNERCRIEDNIGVIAIDYIQSIMIVGNEIIT